MLINGLNDKNVMDMKHLLILLMCAGCLSVTAARQAGGNGYTVETGVTARAVLLEEFTGIHCGFCPQGHAIAKKLAKARKDIYVVAIHGGSYAVPGSDEPDFRTEEGEDIVRHFDVTGFPCGMINRRDVMDTGTPVYGRNMWKALAKAAVAETAPVNLLATSRYDGATRELTVHVEGFFTAAEQPAGQCLNVLWTQSGIVGPQNGGLVGDEYVHRHVLRGYISDCWGDAIDAPAQGGYFERDYRMTLPESVKGIGVAPGDVDIVAFVTVGRQDVANVTACKPSYVNCDMPAGGVLSEPKMPVGSYWGCNFFEAALSNKSDKPITAATFEVEVNGVAATSDWEGFVPPFGTEEITVRCNYAIKETGQNQYRITLKTVNGEDVPESSLGGTFASPRAATLQISVDLKTNREAGENRFCVRDADGAMVAEFGPYPDGQSATATESVTLEAGRIYYIEVTDSWGDGIYSPAGYITSHSADGSLIEQVYSIDDFGVRSFFRTSKETAGISGTDAGADGMVAVWRLDGTMAYSGPRRGMDIPDGTYIVCDRASHKIGKMTITNKK